MADLKEEVEGLRGDIEALRKLVASQSEQLAVAQKARGLGSGSYMTVGLAILLVGSIGTAIIAVANPIGDLRVEVARFDERFKAMDHGIANLGARIAAVEAAVRSK